MNEQKDWRAPGDTTSLTLYPDGPPAQKDLDSSVPSAIASTGEQPDEYEWARAQVRKVVDRYLKNQDCGCPEMIEDLARILTPEPFPSPTGEQPDCGTEWQSGGTAPRDGTEITILLDYPMPAYWDDELRTFVLSRPLHLETVARPIRWRPLVPQPERASPGSEDGAGWPRAGDRMTFLGKNGYDHELEEASGTFVIGEKYVVTGCEVGDWSHSVTFEEIPGRWNGVMFDLVSQTGRVEPSSQLNTESSPETTATPTLRSPVEREALRRIAEKAPDTRLSYTAKELDDFIAACGTRPPPAVVDYTERAREVRRAAWAAEYIEQSDEIIAAALSAVASEHQAEIEALKARSCRA